MYCNNLFRRACLEGSSLEIEQSSFPLLQQFSQVDYDTSIPFCHLEESAEYESFPDWHLVGMQYICGFEDTEKALSVFRSLAFLEKANSKK